MKTQSRHENLLLHDPPGVYESVPWGDGAVGDW